MGSFHAYRVQLNGFLQQDGAAGGVLHLGAGQADAAHRAHGHVSQRRQPDHNRIRADGQGAQRVTNFQT